MGIYHFNQWNMQFIGIKCVHILHPSSASIWTFHHSNQKFCAHTQQLPTKLKLPLGHFCCSIFFICKVRSMCLLLCVFFPFVFMVWKAFPTTISNVHISAFLDSFFVYYFNLWELTWYFISNCHQVVSVQFIDIHARVTILKCSFVSLIHLSLSLGIQFYSIVLFSFIICQNFLD